MAYGDPEAIMNFKDKMTIKATFNLFNVEIKPAFDQNFQIWVLPKSIANDDAENFYKSINTAYRNETLAARAGEDADNYKHDNWYFLTAKNAPPPYLQATQVNQVHHGIILQLLLNSSAFTYDGLGRIRTMDGFYSFAKQQKKGLVAQKMEVIPHHLSNSLVALKSRAASFRNQKAQFGSLKKTDPSLCYVSDKDVSDKGDNHYYSTPYYKSIENKYPQILYKGPLRANTKGNVPWAIGKEHEPYEAKNSYLKKVLAILAQPPFTNWLNIREKTLLKELASPKIKLSKTQLHEDMLKMLAHLKQAESCELSIAFANARSKASDFSIIKIFQEFCSSDNRLFSVDTQIKQIDISNESTVKESVQTFMNEQPQDCFPIFFVDEEKEIGEDNFDPKPVIDDILTDIPHHAIAKQDILDKTLKEEKADKKNLDVPAEIRVILANLMIKKEVIERRILMDRFWFQKKESSHSCSEYLFCDEHQLPNDDNPEYIAIHISNEGSIVFFAMRYDSELAEIAENNEWKQVWYDKAPADVADKTLIIKNCGIRVLPPISPKREGWADTSGIHIIPEIFGYYASYYERPKSQIPTGIVVREIEGAELQDVKNITKLCTDPSIRLGYATVLPAPYKHLREWFRYSKNVQRKRAECG
ncbi:MAG TPA: hypothetical protein EYP59_01500 [Thiotrichaceae bacterium]|nr:hypothetical protein [Thiotrichaceae bacterium]